jgi:hypothetical protein
MSDFILRIRISGPAFQHCPTAEIGRILRTLADELDQLRFAGGGIPSRKRDGDPTGPARCTTATATGSARRSSCSPRPRPDPPHPRRRSQIAGGGAAFGNNAML